MGKNEAFWRSGDPRNSGSGRGFITFTIFLLAVMLASLITFGMARPAETQSGRYAAVVDNAQKDRFAASRAWRKSAASGRQKYGPNFAFATRVKVGPARFRVRIPAAGRYAVFARWPAARANSGKTRIGVRSASGLKWKTVNQRKNGGRWVRLGVYGMSAGNGYNVLVARAGKKSKGRVVADAVRVVKAPARARGGAARGPDSLLGRPIHSQARVASYARSAGSTTYIMHTIRTQSATGWTRRIFRPSRRATQRNDVTYLQGVLSNYDALDQ